MVNHMTQTQVVPQVRCRIAPSPTGDPHVGTAYIALFNYAFAKRHGGAFILRIEDTDQVRSSAESEAAILTSLRWCGVQWDEGPDVGGAHGPYRQSERSAMYRAHAQELLESGHAYRCFCTRERLDEVRARQRAAGLDWRYDRHCRDLSEAEASRRVEAGEGHVIRLRMPVEGQTVVPDALRGEVVIDNERMDDQVLLKSDGLPTYHLANVVDDHAMEITHVIRAEEWINSTPKHVQLYAAFGWQPPVFVHMPLLRNADRSKISKRKNPTSIEFYQRAGYLPEAFLNFLGTLGYSMADGREMFSIDDFVASFDFSRVSLGGPVFDVAKLRDLNGKYIREMRPKQLAARVASWWEQDAEATTELVRERMEDLSEYHRVAAFLRGGTMSYGQEVGALYVGCTSRKKKAIWLDRKRSRGFFETVLTALEQVKPWLRGDIEHALRSAVTETGVTVGDGFMAVRVAICGTRAAPGLFESIETLGRGLTLVRLRAVTALLRNDAALDDEIAATKRALESLLAVKARAEQAASAGGRLGPEGR